MPTLRSAASLLALSLAACTDAPSADGGVDAARPNVLLVVLDDLGAHIGAYGDPNAERFGLSPNFDRPASRATVFDNAYCQVSICGSSRASLLTGLRPDVTTVNTDHPAIWLYSEDNTPDFFSLLDTHPTLLSAFRQNGYLT